MLQVSEIMRHGTIQQRKIFNLMRPGLRYDHHTLVDLSIPLVLSQIPAQALDSLEGRVL